MTSTRAPETLKSCMLPEQIYSTEMVFESKAVTSKQESVWKYTEDEDKGGIVNDYDPINVGSKDMKVHGTADGA